MFKQDEKIFEVIFENRSMPPSTMRRFIRVCVADDFTAHEVIHMYSHYYPGDDVGIYVNFTTKDGESHCGGYEDFCKEYPEIN